ncbi:hypothetical protein SSBR45G_02780 [Bradyrhizobium sp. SSBR45G]|uniref:hypothetical protein n=1 Tax=unclassified Bradyrhizobium TaxID=2631580 RepID=UPI00234291F5|nr:MULTISPECIES: hypothetical protein [unclassified Bradyrhizobium]GLH75370.1 hypothetical protein SSBR45G_02780 [Bradyrhizobium sp. SSBR45G]GLH82843.1 hypothetical protein SSBR45R_03030 [Bradyrhizobium sp. SSBR45R]
MPIEDVETLIRVIASGRRPELLLFWGHTAKANDVGKHVLSQWWPAAFTLDGLTYATADDPQARDPAAWLGLNLLGFALMQARTALG